jgi:hypothetical protein
MKKHLVLLVLLTFISTACILQVPILPATDTPGNPDSSGNISTQTSVPSSSPEISTEMPTQTNPENTPEATSTPVSYGPDGFPANVNPLTGMKVDDPSLLELRPIGIKINIYPRPQYRPTWSLSLADIVYDYYHNDGYTRFHAIFHGNSAELAGAIRSGRLLDDYLVQAYKSIFVYGGADQHIDQVFWNSNYWDRLVREGVEQLCPPTNEAPLCRYDPSGVSNLLAGTNEVHQYIQDKGVDDTHQDLSGMFFDERVPAGGKTGEMVTTRYSSDVYSRWDYDLKTGRYLRYQDAAQDTGQGESYEPLTDRITSEQISAENVVVLFASTTNTLENTRSEIIKIDLIDSGKAYAFRDGQMYELTWNRPEADSVLYLTFPDGSLYPYKPGQTWYQVVGLNSTMVEEEPGKLRFSFRMP